MCGCKLCEYFESLLPSPQGYTQEAYSYLVNHVLSKLFDDLVGNAIDSAESQITFNDDTECYELKW